MGRLLYKFHDDVYNRFHVMLHGKSVSKES